MSTRIDDHTACDGGDNGFSLVETLVALAIFALAFTGLFRAFEGGWRTVRQASHQSAALQVARSKLATAGIEVPLAAGRTTGETPDGIAWEIAVRPYQQWDATKPIAANVPAAWHVAVTATAGGGGASTASVALTTIRLGDRP